MNNDPSSLNSWVIVFKWTNIEYLSENTRHVIRLQGQGHEITWPVSSESTIKLIIAVASSNLVTIFFVIIFHVIVARSFGHIRGTQKYGGDVIALAIEQERRRASVCSSHWVVSIAQCRLFVGTERVSWVTEGWRSGAEQEESSWRTASLSVDTHAILASLCWSRTCWTQNAAQKRASLSPL